MSSLSRQQIEQLSMNDIRRIFLNAASYETSHRAITWEHGADLVNIICIHGERIASRLTD